MMRWRDKLAIISWSIFFATLLSSCERMVTSRNAQLIKEADAKAEQGDYLWAINLYEAALDGTPQSAEIHYKLALLYDDKINDPLHALHHFKRYLTLNGSGKHAEEVRDFIKRDEIALATSLSGDSVITRTEAARLRNENLNLRKQLDERTNRAHAVAADKSPADQPDSDKKKKKTSGRTYIVQEGDTLSSISRKFYKTSTRRQDILDANENKIDDPDNLKPGQKLNIPRE
ncbi:MAG TPA: LysM peptidoglycan-binding domain-containing protein [Chthoniobacterales bacterium]|nr:LysM peptidoglycan-binding domain-containing protein [Chthoniobacterales bacterium]